MQMFSKALKCDYWLGLDGDGFVGTGRVLCNKKEHKPYSTNGCEINCPEIIIRLLMGKLQF